MTEINDEMWFLSKKLYLLNFSEIHPYIKWSMSVL